MNNAELATINHPTTRSVLPAFVSTGTVVVIVTAFQSVHTSIDSTASIERTDFPLVYHTDTLPRVGWFG